MNLLKQLGKDLKPFETITVTAHLQSGKKFHHAFMKCRSKYHIEDYLRKMYNGNCIYWEVL